MTASPPCQGMSANATGYVQSQIKQELRSATDPRNSLILTALDIVSALQNVVRIRERAHNVENESC